MIASPDGALRPTAPAPQPAPARPAGARPRLGQLLRRPELGDRLSALPGLHHPGARRAGRGPRASSRASPRPRRASPSTPSARPPTTPAASGPSCSAATGSRRSASSCSSSPSSGRSPWPRRFVDRFGKGMRTASRDKLIAAATEPEQQGLAFGLHRAMDTMGAVLGPLFAAAPDPVPRAAALDLRRRRDPRHHQRLRDPAPGEGAPRGAAARGLPALAAGRRRPSAGCWPARCSSRVGNSSDMFILLKANSLVAPSASEVFRLSVPVLLYVLYNAVYAAASTPLGGLSDRVGQFPLVIGGYVVFAAVYAGFAAAGSWLVLAGLFAAYGLYIAATEGTSKALISRASRTTRAARPWASTTRPPASRASAPAPSAACCGAPSAPARPSPSGPRRRWRPRPSCCWAAARSGAR